MSIMISQITGNPFNSLFNITPKKISKHRLAGIYWVKSTGNQWIPLTKGQQSDYVGTWSRSDNSSHISTMVLCEGNSPVASGFPSQWDSNAEWVRTAEAMKGASAPPIRAENEHNPKPTFRIIVGNNSTV